MAANNLLFTLKNMKKNKFFEVVGLGLFLMFSNAAYSQGVDSVNLIRSIMTATYLSPSAPKLTQNTIVQNPDALVSKEIPIYPSTNPQSEIHISINKTNPRVLLLSSNTLLPNISNQGAWWSTNGGNSWNGAPVFYLFFIDLCKKFLSRSFDSLAHSAINISIQQKQKQSHLKKE